MTRLVLLPLVMWAVACSDSSVPLAPDSQPDPAFRAASAAVKVAIYNEYYICDLVDLGTTWFTGKDGKLWHNKGYTSKNCFSDGDFTGHFFAGPGNLMIDFAKGSGPWTGQVTYVVTWDDLSGTFVGMAHARMEGYEQGFGGPNRRASGTFVGQGTGDFEGMKYHNSWFTDFVAGEGYESGYILMPHAS